MSANKILTEEVLEKFARWDEENKQFRQQFERTCLNVFGTASSLLQGNLLLVVDNCCHKQCPWKVECSLTVQAFLG